MISPESFIDALSATSDVEIRSLNHLQVFTIRQLATLDPDREVLGMPEERLNHLKEQALSVVNSHQLERTVTVPQQSGDVWGYCYVSKAIYDMIVFENVYKSPFALFDDLMSLGKSNNAWKSICGEVLEEHEFSNPPSDSDIYSFLIWRCANTVAKSDYTIGARAIPFVWEWMPGMMHGTSMQLTKMYAEHRLNPAIADRYDYQIGINLSKICQQGGEIYSVNYQEKGSKVINKYKWQPIHLREVGRLQKDISLWSNFTAGDNYRDNVPHGIVVPANGIISGDCLHLFARNEAEVVEIRY